MRHTPSSIRMKMVWDTLLSLSSIRMKIGTLTAALEWRCIRMKIDTLLSLSSIRIFSLSAALEWRSYETHVWDTRMRHPLGSIRMKIDTLLSLSSIRIFSLSAALNEDRHTPLYTRSLSATEAQIQRFKYTQYWREHVLFGWDGSIKRESFVYYQPQIPGAWGGRFAGRKCVSLSRANMYKISRYCAGVLNQEQS